MKVIDDTTYATARSRKNKSNLPTKAAIIKEKIYTPHNVNRGNVSSNILRSVFIILYHPIIKSRYSVIYASRKTIVTSKGIASRETKNFIFGLKSDFLRYS